MAEFITGYKRSLMIVVTKTMNGNPMAGYPKTYPTTTDIANGYFTYNSVNYAIPSPEDLARMDLAEYNQLVLKLRQYASLNEPDIVFINSNREYDEANCVPGEITTTTTEEVTTTTTAEVTTTTTTIEPCVENGALYNWYAVTDERGITNGEMSVPTEDQFIILFDNTGTEYEPTYWDSGGNLKDTSNEYWDSPNEGATNQFNMSIRGSGQRDPLTFGMFRLIKSMAFLWTTDEKDDGYGEIEPVIAVFYSNFSDATLSTIDSKSTGLSIRLVRGVREHEESLIDGQYADDYVGNNGITYKCVKIGAQVWLAENLAETKFNNGDIIPWYGANQIDLYTNSEWRFLSTPGVCAYNNDFDLVGCDFAGFPEITTTTTTT
jgi:uncharacterized protein (TIGR02145 family)